MARVFLLILDSFGVGGAPDAEQFGDLGADTLGHIAQHCLKKRSTGALKLKSLENLGLANASKLATGSTPSGLTLVDNPAGLFGVANEVSNGKDTPSGHWEIAGQPVKFDWSYFPKTIPTFPDELTQQICDYLGIEDILGNCHASGTEVIARFGLDHLKSGRPICYTSTLSLIHI